MSPVERFEEVRALDERALRSLLATGDALERTWAVWALGLRAADGAATIAAHAPGEPSPGVRRALAVVLASHGESDLVVALARHDPDVYVRATALGLLFAPAAAGRVPWSIVIDAFDHDGAPVRAALLPRIDATAPAGLRARIAPALADPDADVRFEAFEALVRLGDDLAPVRAYPARASKSERKVVFHRWRGLATPDAIAAALADARDDVRAELADFLAPRGWRELAPLVADDPRAFLARWWQAGVALDEVPLAYLIDVAIATPSESWIVHRLAPQLDRDEDVPADRWAALATACDQVLAQLAPYDLEDADDDFDPVAELAQRRARLTAIRDRAIRPRGSPPTR